MNANMSNEVPSGPPPPYPGGYSTQNDYSAFPQGGYAPPPTGYAQPPAGYAQPSAGYAQPSAGYGPPPPGYGPPPPGYAQPPQPYAPAKVAGGSYPTQTYGPGGTVHGTTVVVSQPAVTLIQTFRESPVRTLCNHCQSDVVTGLHYETGTFTWVICLVLWFFGGGLGCCLIPFCVDSCKDVIHTCPNCHQQIARYSRM